MSPPDSAAALDPVNIRAVGAEMGEKLLLHLSGPDGTISELIGIGRHMIRMQIDAIEAVSGVHDPDFRRFWGDLLAEALVGRWNELSPRVVPSGAIQ